MKPRDYERLLGLIDRLAGHRVVVVGDVILDEYLIGRTDRLSREAPIPVLEFERRDVKPGGAANPAANITSLGSHVQQVGVIGADPQAETLRAALQTYGIDTAGLVVDAQRPTTTKTRLMAHMGLRFPQQLARLDYIQRQPVNGEVERAVIARIQQLASAADAILASDYLTGLLTPTIARAIQQVSAAHRLLAIADVQGQFEKYENYLLIKCNADEAMRFVRRDLHTNEDFVEAGKQIASTLDIRLAVVITRGADGIMVVQPEYQAGMLIPAPQVEDVYDTVGAGDTVLAITTLALLAGASIADAAALANIAAGIVIRKVGNYSPTAEELRQALTELKNTPLLLH